MTAWEHTHIHRVRERGERGGGIGGESYTILYVHNVYTSEVLLSGIERGEYVKVAMAGLKSLQSTVAFFASFSTSSLDICTRREREVSVTWRDGV